MHIGRLRTVFAVEQLALLPRRPEAADGVGRGQPHMVVVLQLVRLACRPEVPVALTARHKRHDRSATAALGGKAKQGTANAAVTPRQ